MRQETIEVGSTKVAMKIGGSGPPLLFLHGAGGGAQWSPLHESLTSQFTVYAPIHPGWGDEWMPEWLDTVEDLVFHYGLFAQQLGLREITVLGVSLGGWIAAEFAAFRPDLCKALILVDPAGFKPENPAWQQDLFDCAPADMPKLLFADPAKMAAMAGGQAGPPGVDAMLEMYRGNAALARLMWRRNYDPKLRLRASRITAPTLIVWGAQDGLFRVEHGRTVARTIPGSEFVVIDGAGHVPYMEQPEAFSNAFWAFVQKHQLASVPEGVHR